MMTDLEMPGMNGAELIEQVRKIDASIKVILASSNTALLASIQNKPGAANPDLYLEKPIEIADLLKSVEGLLDVARQ